MPRHRFARSRFSWSKFSLSFLVIICALAIIWTGYLFYTQQLKKITATIIFAATIAVLVWDAILISRYRVGPGIVVAAFIITALVFCTVPAFSGIEPFTSAKNKVMNFTQSLSSELPASLNEITTSSTSSPAIIHGHVIIADKLQALTAIPVPPNPNNNEEVFWIVKVTFKNLSYGNPIVIRWDKCYEGWVIIGGGEIYKPNCVGSITSDSSFNVAQGQSGEFTFNIIVPRSLTIDEAKICYQGQEPFSYGILSGGGAVLAYDWESKSVITNPLDNFMVAGENMQLRTIASWTGSENTPIRFEADKSPWVVNWGYEKVSSIKAIYNIVVVDEADYDDMVARYGTGWQWGIAFGHDYWVPDKYGSIVVPRVGKFVIMVDASGVNWQVKVGVE
jgi:hypothetical protein